MSLGHQPHDSPDSVTPQELIQQLRGLTEKLPEALQAQVLAAGAVIVPGLLAVIEDEIASDQTGRAWVPQHAAQLLGALGDASAAPVLLCCLERCFEFDPLSQHIIDALVALGPLVIDECLKAYATTTNDDTRDSIATVLSRCGTQEVHVYEVLLHTLERSPMLGANCLVDYGDPQAILALSQCFDTLSIGDKESLYDSQVSIELRSAIEDLGGQLTAEQAAKAERAEAPSRRFVAQVEGFMSHLAEHSERIEQVPPPPSIGTDTATRKQRKLGRNEPCWCGSDKKYKKCHLDLDRRQ